MPEKGDKKAKRVPMYPNKARPDNGHRIKPGEVRNPKGRPKGAKDRVPRELKEILSEALKSPAYQANLVARMRKGRLHPVLEKTAWEHEIGKVADRTVVDVGPTLADILRAAAGQSLGAGAQQAAPLQSGDSTDGGGDQEQAQLPAFVSSKIVDGGKDT